MNYRRIETCSYKRVGGFIGNVSVLAISLSGLTMCKINVNILFTINLQAWISGIVSIG